ncbi:helix-turn-helix domain-containing protein [Clostridium sp. MCC353]|uniref:helix-turn-helix domain-containing protein n=1 Tax=Clostridium sp. MCC353 TaxID=2592646 RepID=UPI001C009C27|nr:AraC family transcriptional regulator [Clostridium sp. MCC353]MBT9776643.1 helix-turn-helix domain-containing protein [Clostridium sp. MCC353]
MREQIEAVQRMQDYIEKHLQENIALADLAKASLYSPWYSYRLFIQWLNMTPADYIRRLRLSKSALKLRDERVKIADTAFEFGFKSVDGYQRAFFREFGCNPKEYASRPVPIYLFRPYGIKYSALEKENVMENIRNVFIQVIEKPKRKAIIKRGVQASDYWTYCQEVGCDVWGLLLSIKSISMEPVCLWLPKQYIKPGTSEYVQGVEVPTDYDGPIPEGFDIIELPAAKYLMFQGEPFEEEDYCQAIDEVQDAISRYDPSVIGYSWDPANPRIQLEPVGTRGYIELAAVIQAR